MQDAGMRRLADFGSQLREALKASDLSQKEIAAAAGVSVAALGHWARGRNLPRLDHLDEVADAAGYDLVLHLVKSKGPESSYLGPKSLVELARAVEDMSAGDRRLVLMLVELLQLATFPANQRDTLRDMLRLWLSRHRG